MVGKGQGFERDMLAKVNYCFTCEEGPDVFFRVARMQLQEDLNGGYELELDLVTDSIDADTDSLLGASCQLEICRGERFRSVYGVIVAVDYVGHSEDYLVVSVRIGPAFELLSLQTHSRIFQDLSVQQILEEVLGSELARYSRTFDHGSVSRGHVVRDYCVQYRETDLEFCVRLMEEEGISYFFVHSEDLGHEVLTFSYENEDFDELQNVDECSVVPIIGTRPETADLESIQSFDFLQTLTTTSAFRRDYGFCSPRTLLEDAAFGLDGKGRERRIYHHTDRRYTADDVAARNLDALQAAQVRGKQGRGTSNVIGMMPAKIFEIEGHSREDLETKFLVTQVVHAGECPEELLSVADGSATDLPRYSNFFRCIPVDVPFRAERLTPKPRVYGSETGIVTGPPGEEIHVDEFGRVKVQFHWEEDLTYDDTSSCWIRVRQQWSGPGWGFQFIPRVGQEVVVEFLGGDPDRPLVVGTVYNGENAYPYPLPEEKTKSTIRTSSSPGGEGYNELRFEDAAGAEEVFVHAQRDQNTVVRRNNSRQVGGAECIGVEGSRQVTITGNHSVVVNGKDSEQALKSPHYSVTVNDDYQLAAAKTVHVTAEEKITLQCKTTFLELTPTSIVLQAGEEGARVELDVEALIQSKEKGTVHLDKVGNVVAKARDEASVSLTSSVVAVSQAGAKVTLDGEAKMGAPGADDGKGAAVRLSADAKTTGNKVEVVSQGASLTMTTKAELTSKESTVISGVKAACVGKQSALVQGGKVDVLADLITAIKGKAVTIN